jgi:non-heme chloroperoxidase
LVRVVSSRFARAVLRLVAVLAITATQLLAQAPVDIASRYFTASDGTRLHALEAMPDSLQKGGPVIAFIPGWSMPAWIWRQQLGVLGST